jgi:hypothetical protein
LCEQHTLGRVQSLIGPRREVGQQAIAEEKVVHERPVLLVREIRLDDFFKKRRVLA